MNLTITDAGKVIAGSVCAFLLLLTPCVKGGESDAEGASEFAGNGAANSPKLSTVIREDAAKDSPSKSSATKSNSRKANSSSVSRSSSKSGKSKATVKKAPSSTTKKTGAKSQTAARTAGSGNVEGKSWASWIWTDPPGAASVKNSTNDRNAFPRFK